MDDKTFKKHLDQFATEINGGHIGLIQIMQENWAKPLRCYNNVRNKIIQSGGMEVFGWTFLSKRSKNGDYLIAQHHAVWGSPDRNIIDVTPYLDEHYPLAMNGNLLFLMDLDVQPIIINGVFAPTPSKFYPITKSDEMNEYISELKGKEIDECNKSYNFLNEKISGHPPF